jgi:hypothetical protein
MATSKWVYDRVTQQFLYGGFYEPTCDPLTQGIAVCGETHPDPRLERYDAVVMRRPATTAEIAAFDATRADVQADVEVTKALKAIGFVLLQRILGHVPTALERQQLMAEVKAAYKALP